jgi:hypothetical protein
MIDPKQDLLAWLSQEPAPEDIRYNDDGSLYQPVEVVKEKLDILDIGWSTKNFHHFYFQPIDGSWRISGSVELRVQYVLGGVVIDRSLVGASTFDTQEYTPNTHYAQTCLSLCIVAAAKEIGAFFGKNLNKGLEPELKIKQLKKKKAGLIEKQKMSNAVLSNDQKTIDELNENYTFDA